MKRPAVKDRLEFNIFGVVWGRASGTVAILAAVVIVAAVLAVQVWL